MAVVKPPRVRRPLSAFSRVILLILGVVSLVMAILGVMARFGLMLIDTQGYLWMLIALAAVLIAWGVGVLALRLKSRVGKFALVGGAAVVVLLLLTLLLTYTGYFFSYIPTRFSEITGKGGEQAIVFRGYYYDQARVSDRHPTTDGSEALPESLDDYSYIYSIYPKRLWLFYDANADMTGQVIIGVDSAAKLMIDWPDETTARLYIENPEAFDTGECLLKFAK